MRTRSLLFIVVALFSASVAFADVTTLGNGFKCDGTSILKGAKTVSYTKAKSTLTKTIAKLKEKLADAPKNKRAGIKAKIKSATTSKKLIQACSKGQLGAGQVDPVFSNLASGSGIYSGTYIGTVSGFIPVSGPIKVTFTLVGTVFSATLEIGGQVGNSLNFQPLSFSNDVGGVGFPAQFFLPNTFLGDVTLSVTQDGHLTITNSNSTNATVTFDGQFSNATIVGNLNGSYSSVPFQSNFTLNRN